MTIEAEKYLPIILKKLSITKYFLVEQVYGTNKFLLLYFSSGLGAALIALLFSYYNFYSILDVLVSSDINKSAKN